MMTFFRYLTLVILSNIVLSCSDSSETGMEGPPPTVVTVSEVRQADVPVFLEAIGSLKPNKRVSLYAHIEGVLQKAPFDEGSHILKEELVFQIAPEVYLSKLEKARASLNKTKTNLAFGRKKLERYSGLVGKEYVTPLSFEEIQNEVADYESSVEIAKAEVALAQQDLKNCFIHAPIEGILGEQKVTTLDYVEHNTLLSTIVQIKVLYVDFTLPEKHVYAIRKALSEEKALPIEVITQEGYTVAGEITFVETTVDPTTGTLMLRGRIPNEDRLLQPGIFVNVKLRVDKLKDATVIPQKALQYGQKGTYVYIVKSDQTVELFNVTPKQPFDEDIVIEEEMDIGTQIVTEGQLNLYPGAKVEIKP
ncbi:MAG: Multidrug resistance protein MdtA [Chlamydiae bacterium]|nr:Multidrug resistance protein MdtA [Chlamydiota bacterium]